MRQLQTRARLLVKGDGSLDSTLVFHCCHTFAPLFKLVSLVDNSRNLHLARVQIVNRSGKLIGFAEAADDRDLVANLMVCQQTRGEEKEISDRMSIGMVTYRSCMEARRRGLSCYKRHKQPASHRGGSS